MGTDILSDEEVTENIEELEDLAQKVLELKQDSRPRRPIFIEFCGTPKSGKSSCINSLNTFLKRNHFDTTILTERAGVCPVEDKFDPFFNMWTTCSAITELSKLFSNEAKNLDVIIADRAIFDGLIWFKWMVMNDRMDKNNYESTTQFLLMKKWRALIDLVYVFKASPEVSMYREYANLLTRETGTIMNEDTLTSYNNAIDNTIEDHKELFRKVITIDTSDKDQNEVSFDATKTVLNILKDITTERIGYIEREKLSQFEDKLFFNYDEINGKINLNFDYRDEVEENSNFIQPIPIITITDEDRDKVLVVKKKHDSLSNKSPEKDKLLIYSGGHIRKEDNVNVDNILPNSDNFLSVSNNALAREIKEELDISISPCLKSPLCIWYKGNSKSEKHLAILFVFETDFNNLNIKLDSYEYIQKRGKSKSGQIFDFKDLEEESENLESWSKIILQEVFDIQFGNQVNLFG